MRRFSYAPGHFGQGYTPLASLEPTTLPIAAGNVVDYETKAKLSVVEESLGLEGLSAIQDAMMPSNAFCYTLIRPIQSWLHVDTLTMNLEITDFALTHLQRIFDKPFCEEIRADEMQHTWENIPYIFEADGMPPFLGTLSKHIANEAKCILVKKWSAYCTGCMQSSWSRRERRLKEKLNSFCKEHLLTEVCDDPWRWSCAFEELLLESADDERTTKGRASDVVLDDLHRHKQRIIACLINYRSSVQVQLGKAQSIRLTFLAVGTSFAFAAWSCILNSYL